MKLQFKVVAVYAPGEWHESKETIKLLLQNGIQPRTYAEIIVVQQAAEPLKLGDLVTMEKL